MQGNQFISLLGIEWNLGLNIREEDNLIIFVLYSEVPLLSREAWLGNMYGGMAGEHNNREAWLVSM